MIWGGVFGVFSWYCGKILEFKFIICKEGKNWSLLFYYKFYYKFDKCYWFYWSVIYVCNLWWFGVVEFCGWYVRGEL